MLSYVFRVPFLAATMLVLMVFFAALSNAAAETTELPLGEAGAPDSTPTQAENEPVLFLSQPAAGFPTTGTAVIICPGGGYGHLSMEKEGSRIADWFNSFGVTSLVLRYRHHGTGHMHPTPLHDGQRAIRTVRARAAEWGIDPTRIGVMGFSAGGHLASTLGTHFDGGQADAADPVDRASSRPDFLILCYPVISLVEEYTHQGSRRNLLGDAPSEELLQSLSNELQVTSQSPPTFLFHTDADTGVPAENSVAFYLALRRAGVPAELHIYEKGSHGVGMAAELPGTNDWPVRCRAWMQARGLLTPRQP